MTPEDTTPPPITKQAAALAAALVEWKRRGFPVAPDAVIEERRAICAACPSWDAPGVRNLWLGRCKACGCSGGKAFLATSRCPKNKWLPVVKNPAPAPRAFPDSRPAPPAFP